MATQILKIFHAKRIISLVWAKRVLSSLEDLAYKSGTIKKMVSSNGWYEAWGMNVCGALRPWYEKVL